MTLEEFLQLAKKRKKEIEILNRDRSVYNAHTYEMIVLLLKSSFVDVPDSFFESKVLFEKIKVQLNITYDLIVPFLRHYAKTDEISFTYTEEDNWKMGLAEIHNKNQQLLDAIHLLLKKRTVNKYPLVVDLPSKGFLELDFLLHRYSSEIVNIVYQEIAFY